MTTNFEKTSVNEGVLTFEIPVEDVKAGLDIAFKKVQKRISVPGFRKGKVPRKIFDNVYGEAALYEDTLNALLPAAYERAVKEADINVVTQPKIDIDSMEKGQPWVLKANVTLKPEVKLGEYKNLTVEKQDTTVTDEDVKADIEAKRKRLAELVVKEDAAENGDTVVIDFEGFLGEEAFEGGKGENHSLELGSNSFIPGFEDQLVGVKAGEEKDVNVTFPEEYHAEALAGKEATFKVKVHEVKALELPELDDEFAKDVDEEVETLAELENKVRVQLTESKEAAAKEMKDDLAIRQAVENAEIVELPHEMVHEEIHRQMDHFLNNLKRQGIDEQLYYQITGTTSADLHDQFGEEAELRTKTNLVLEAIVEAEDLQVSDDEIEKEVAELATQYNMTSEQVKQFVSTDMLTSDIKLKKAMELIVSTAEEK
ncbi:trigger factor [Tuanshanicoccus lijuaniae]|uniref:trigger factor n=1 Tax=Aerococcaceae bacterium zg-1292 TaxID=2774330 RepID=UPI001BD860FA|nr:trigger factor [Aerococcaceae bacterium zg-BR9]MBF6977772.1 trigger factor [Aerococcaceae bacterium zg-BR22]MBS4456024.1 trigger factor [Aerococcaceae bacterium zg-A91]MBS4457776.1 trigger factor [Aerococcaceae bacterium zg-BR33]